MVTPTQQIPREYRRRRERRSWAVGSQPRTSTKVMTCPVPGSGGSLSPQRRSTHTRARNERGERGAGERGEDQEREEKKTRRERGEEDQERERRRPGGRGGEDQVREEKTRREWRRRPGEREEKTRRERSRGERRRRPGERGEEDQASDDAAFEYSLRTDSDLASDATPTLQTFYHFAQSLEENMDATRKAVVAVALAEDEALQNK
ncbi:unnamed protein product [Boreogadus saida]